MTIKRKIAIGIVGTICLLTGVGALWAGMDAVRASAKLSEARSERPASFDVQLSNTNSVTVPLARKYDLGHGFEVLAKLPGGLVDEDAARSKLAGLRIYLSAGLNGKPAGAQFFDGTNSIVSVLPEFSGCAVIGRINTAATGAGDFHLEVVEPAKELDDTKVHVFLANSYCGLEKIHIAFMWFMTVACAVITLVSGFITRSMVKSTAPQTPLPDAIASN